MTEVKSRVGTVEEAAKIQAKINDDAEKLYTKIDNLISDFVRAYEGVDEGTTAQVVLKRIATGDSAVIEMGTIPLTIFSAVATILTKLAILGGMEREDLLCLLDGLILNTQELQEKIKANNSMMYDVDTSLPN